MVCENRRCNSLTLNFIDFDIFEFLNFDIEFLLFY